MARRLLIVVACVFVSSGHVRAADIQLTPDGQVPGKPFEALQQQLEELKQQIATMASQSQQIATLQQQVAALNEYMAAAKPRGVYRFETNWKYEQVTVAPGEYATIFIDAPIGAILIEGSADTAMSGDDPAVLTLVREYTWLGSCHHLPEYDLPWHWHYATFRNDTSQPVTNWLSVRIAYAGESLPPAQFLGCD